MKQRKRGNRKTRKLGFWARNYSASWVYIKESKRYVWAILAIFLFSTILGWVYQPSFAVDWVRQFVQQLLDQTAGLNTWQLIIYILDNNLRSSFIGMIAGVFLGIFPVATTIANGYVLGFVGEKSVQAEGLGVLLRLFPHGIFELPAVFLALALGTRFGMFWFSKDKKKEFISRLENSLRVFLFVILPLLIIAAIIEGTLIRVMG